ncbi:MAG: uroporphyrinogen decarboxylase family protein [Planctomycetota bacterium]
MNSRERFECACSHKEPDRVPIDYLAHPRIDKRLKSHYGIKTEEDLLDILGCDFYYLSSRDMSQNESCLSVYKGPRLEMTDSERICPLGIRWQRSVYDSKFTVDDAIKGPLENARTKADVLNFAWPKAEWFDMEPLGMECEKHCEKIIVGGFWSGIFGDSYRMLGFENFLLNMAMRPDLIKTLVSRMTELYLELNEKMFSELKGKIDVWFFGNDFGDQKSLLFSEEMFSEFFLGSIRQLTAMARSYGLRVMMHSCGAISRIIPMLIEAGVELLDPVQVTAEGMAAVELKKQFGDKIVFHGAIDTQHILPMGTPKEVHDHAEATIEILSSGGGYIFAPCNVIQPDTPVENVVAMYQAAKKHKIQRRR